MDSTTRFALVFGLSAFAVLAAVKVIAEKRKLDVKPEEPAPQPAETAKLAAASYSTPSPSYSAPAPAPRPVEKKPLPKSISPLSEEELEGIALLNAGKKKVSLAEAIKLLQAEKAGTSSADKAPPHSLAEIASRLGVSEAEAAKLLQAEKAGTVDKAPPHSSPRGIAFSTR